MQFPTPVGSLARDVGLAELDGAVSVLDLRHNVLTDRPEVSQPGGWVAVTDAHITMIRRWLATVYVTPRGRPYTPAVADVEAVLHERARRAPHHPVRAYLEGLPAWDGTDRIEWLCAEMGCDDALSVEMMTRWLVAAVARARWPGCKADNVLVLVGEQGARKSSLIHTLAAGRRTAHAPWSSDSHVGDVGDKDTAMRMRAAWIIEVQELDGLLARRDAQAVKAFLTTAEDHYRAPYARTVEPHARTSVCVGTSNTDGFLRDPTGNRRFWPLRVGRRVSEATLRQLADVRGQVWAQALALLAGDPRWYLLPDDEASLADRQHGHAAAADDPWYDVITRWLDGRGDVGLRDVFAFLEVPVEKQSRAHCDRVTSILRAHGYRRAHTAAGKRWVR